MSPWLTFGLLACAPGPNLDTQVDELLVVALVPESPELAAGETSWVEAHVADPDASGALAMVWTCTPGPDGCLETLDQQAPVLLEGSPPLLRGAWQVPDALSGPVAAAGELPTSLWVLGCAPGLCPPIEDLLDGERPSRAWLQNPLGQMDTVPLIGVSLARRTIWLSNRPTEDRRRHPVLAVDGLPGRAQTEAELSLELDVEPAQDGAITGFGLSTGGAFGEVSIPVENGQAKLDWYGPEAEQQSQLWVTVQDEAGGIAVWTDSVEIHD